MIQSLVGLLGCAFPRLVGSGRLLKRSAAHSNLALLLPLGSPRAASGSNQWKLAHQNEGKAKATDRAIGMTSSRRSPGLGRGSSLV